MPDTIVISTELAPITCGCCGGTYAIAETYRQNAYNKAGSWHCPYCQCSWGYSETEIDRLKKQIMAKENEAQLLRQKADQFSNNWRRENAARIVIERKLRKEQERIRNGVCPECHRTFDNVAQHMKSCHCGKDAAKKQGKARKEVTCPTTK